MQKKLLPLALVLVLLLTLLACLGFRVEAEPTIGIAAAGKEVYLTFDDGPSTRVTGRVLDVLSREEVKGTFFIVSDRVAGREETLRRIAREGHTLGVHSASHVYSEIYASDEAFRRDVGKCAAVIEEVTGVVPRVYRFPGGGMAHKKRLTKIVEALGYRVVEWNAVCGDEEIPRADAAALIDETVKTSAGKTRVVLLLHDSASHAATADALPAIISYFRREGYTFRSF